MVAEEANSDFKNLRRSRYLMPFKAVGPGGGVIGFLGGGMLGVSILGVFLAVIIATFFLIFLTPGITKGGEITDDSIVTTPPPIVPGKTPTCADVDALLLNDFGVIIREAGENASCEDRKKIYKIYSIPTQSPTYLKLLKPSRPFTLIFYPRERYGYTSGYTPTGNAIELKGFISFINNGSSWFKLGSFLLIHETGHLMRHRNSFITNTYPNSSLVASDPGCYSFGYLKTYSRKGSNKASENIAEGSALYVYNSKSGFYATISNFRVQCNSTYAWIRKYIYGSIDINP